MDLTSVEGWADLPDSMKQAITSQVSESEQGLKTKVDQLLTEKKGVQSESDSQKIALEEARKAATDAAEQRLIAEGKYDEAQALREKERADLIAEANAERDKANAALDKYHLNNAKNGVKLQVLPEFQDAADALLNLSTAISYDDNGNAITIFKHGEKEFSSHSDYLDGVADDPMWSRMLKGADSSGAGTKQSNTTGGASSSDYANMTTEQKVQHLKNNPPMRA